MLGIADGDCDSQFVAPSRTAPPRSCGHPPFRASCRGGLAASTADHRLTPQRNCTCRVLSACFGLSLGAMVDLRMGRARPDSAERLGMPAGITASRVAEHGVVRARAPCGSRAWHLGVEMAMWGGGAPGEVAALARVTTSEVHRAGIVASGSGHGRSAPSRTLKRPLCQTTWCWSGLMRISTRAGSPRST